MSVVKSQKGFTLVEIAIVMVIIGLLLGGVLKGQELIKNSKIRSIMNDADGMWAAIYTYQDRYGALAGDDDSADTHIGVAPADNGNGNGRVDTAGELGQVFAHLRKSGLIKGVGITPPKHTFGKSIAIDSAKFGLVGTVVCFDGLDKEIANIIDIKEDDGASNTGAIRGGVRSSDAVGANYTASVTYDICLAL